MMKAILVGAAMLAAVPAAAQVNLNTGAPPPPETPTKPEAPDAAAATADTPEGPTVTQGTEGTTHSHSVTSGTEGTVNTTESGATMAAGASNALSATSYSGVGGPATGDLLDLAGEMLGDGSRVERVMRGGDRSMKASDLLNSAMLAMIQSSANRPK